MVSDILLNLNYPFFIPNNFEHNLGRSSSLSINVKNQTVSSNNSEMNQSFITDISLADISFSKEEEPK